MSCIARPTERSTSPRRRSADAGGSSIVKDVCRQSRPSRPPDARRVRSRASRSRHAIRALRSRRRRAESRRDRQGLRARSRRGRIARRRRRARAALGGRSSLRAVGGRGAGWHVEIVSPRTSRPLAHVWLRDAAIGTSGAGEQFVECDGRRYGHVIDPRTGWPAPGMLSVTVIASSAAVADALSTAFLVGGVELAERVLRRRIATSWRSSLESLGVRKSGASRPRGRQCPEGSSELPNDPTSELTTVFGTHSGAVVRA